MQVDYRTLLCQKTTDDVLNLKCEACVLSVTVLFCIVYRNNFNRSIILLGFLPHNTSGIYLKMLVYD